MQVTSMVIGLGGGVAMAVEIILAVDLGRRHGIDDAVDVGVNEAVDGCVDFGVDFVINFGPRWPNHCLRISCNPGRV